MSELLRLDALRKSHGSGEGTVEVLRGVSLSVERGEFLAIMGASGSGKTTLLNMMGLLDRPTSGTVRLLGREVSELSENEAALLRCRSIGFIFQNFNLLPYLNARRNVELPMEYAGTPDSGPKAEALLRRVGLDHRAGHFPATLSGGERQRVAIARALANEPAFLLADEPTGSLDSRTGAQVLNLFAELHHAGSTIVLITHDEAVGRRAQRVLSMRDGRLE